MELIEGLDQIATPFDKAVLTIGNFDGVHIGHQALFHEVIEKADAIGGTSVAITFDPHPLRVLRQNGQPPLITLHEQKVELISRSGVDVLITLPFTRELANVTADQFVSDILIRRIGMAVMIVGGDYAFGRNREGNLDFLRRRAADHDFELIVADWIQAPNNGYKRISSTRIRELVKGGRVDEAQKLLGRHYQIRGKVAEGRKRGGKLLGCPTANIQLDDELAPRTGVYAVIVEHGGNRYKGVANIGYSPTFDDYIYTVEVHILDFGTDIYGDKIRVNFVTRIRDEKKFANIDELAGQIRRDIEMGREMISL